MQLTKFEESLHERLRDADYAQAYLQAALSEGGKSEWLIALKEVASATDGGLTRIAREAKLGRESIYKSLSVDGNPRWSTVQSVVDALGYELIIRRKGLVKSKAITKKTPATLRSNIVVKTAKSRTQSGE